MSLRHSLNQLLGSSDESPHCILPYRGYGTDAHMLVLARVLRDPRVGGAVETASRWRNAWQLLQRVDADPLPGARVFAQVNGGQLPLVADGEGFVRGWVAAPVSSAGDSWRNVELVLPAGAHGKESRAQLPVLVPPPTARFGVISDIDDTVLRSEVGNPLEAARLMLMENARTRLPFPGVAEFYRALVRGATGSEGNPIFYVSSSPWNLYDVIEEFLNAQDIPAGPLLLRDWDLNASLLGSRTHKLEHIREVFSTYSGMPFILIGDSTQEDPETYAELVRGYPGRILAVYIRNVRSSALRAGSIARLGEELTAAGSTLVLCDDTIAAARHAADRGWIAAPR